MAEEKNVTSESCGICGVTFGDGPEDAVYPSLKNKQTASNGREICEQCQLDVLSDLDDLDDLYG